ncbi:LysR family transcriptional regulator [Pleomorphomonas oryzae]|uniref:LysR family transcriptional regulator n=1 Tax=Pleomorphomonas oryzae TaxID=261934 RepID=UPI0004204F9D|nr:LysR family transcriptional regulator [Pleomorphomonas oryzae]
MTKPTLSDLEAFAAIVRYRSFRKAADELGLSRSTLSHTLIGLERNLGVRLLHRTTRSVSPTDVGARLLERINPVLWDLDMALDGLAADAGEPSGRLRINANKSAACFLLSHVVPPFLRQYPQVELDLVSEGRLIDIVREGFDAGVRLAEAVPQDMIAVPVGGSVRFVAVASPDYLSEHTPPTTPDDLHRHACIRQRLPSGKRYRWEFVRSGVEMTIDVPGALTLDDSDLMVQAATDGLGIAYVPEPIARPALDSGKLTIVLPDWSPPLPGLMLYYPANRHTPSSLRAFIELLKDTNRRLVP